MPRRRSSKSRKSPKPPLDPIGLARQLRRRGGVSALLVVAAVVCLILIDRAAGVLPVDDDWHRYHGQRFFVTRVIDGDTLELRVPDGTRKTTRVRLWGVDTPELAKPGSREESEPWAEEAAAFSREQAEGRHVTLFLQRHRVRGRYGRLLAYVELPDGAVLNELLLTNGFSEPDDRWSHDRAEPYDDLARSARKLGLGMWSD